MAVEFEEKLNILPDRSTELDANGRRIEVTRRIMEKKEIMKVVQMEWNNINQVLWS